MPFIAFDAEYPSSTPNSNPPNASFANNHEMVPSEIDASGVCVSCNITANSTTAIPSLKRDSPVIFVSRDLLTLAF